jgi:transposase
MSNGSGLSRGDRVRNERLDRLRAAVPVSNAIVGIDLAQRVQMLVVTDHDSRVLARRKLRCEVWGLGAALDWALGAAQRAGFGAVTVACEPTGHRWRVVEQLAAERRVPFVCVQPLLVGRSREAEDYSRDKTDDRDAMLIARLVSELRCYLPEPAEETWSRLRQLGARRGQLVTRHSAAVQQLRDLLDTAWPAALTAAGEPFDSATWCAAMTVVLSRAAGDLSRVRRLGAARFCVAVRRELPRWGAHRLWSPIAMRVFDALNHPDGVLRLRAGLLERAELVFDDLHDLRRRRTETESRMLAILEGLELRDLVCSIPGLTALGAACLLAETGDVTRFVSGRSLVKHAGIAPAQRSSGASVGRTTVTGRGRPGLRLAAWRTAMNAVRVNPVYAARFTHLTSRPDNPLAAQQARVAIAGSLLRQLHAVITTRTAWRADIARDGLSVPSIAA